MAALSRLPRLLLATCALLLLAACAAQPPRADTAVSDERHVIVAVEESPVLHSTPGQAPRADYRQRPGYGGSATATAAAQRLAQEHGLAEVKAWTITALRWRCMLYRLPEGVERATTLARLAADPAVRLAQPLNHFQTLTTLPPTAYNDPYLSLQNGFAAIGAAAAQRHSLGERVTIALVDTGVDVNHPDLQGRVAASRDFVGQAAFHERGSERHGTEMAGVIAAAANNGIGIAGIAPGARLLSLRACWGGGAAAQARCNSFTLAEALAAALAAGADVINLSLGGPRDPLLEALLQQALARGVVVVGAVPEGGQRSGFPSAVPGVLAVAAQEQPGRPASGVLAAPGQRILTLAPGGGYDYASGSSLAAAHVSATVALLRGVDATLSGAALTRLLTDSEAAPRSGIHACRALQRLRPGWVCQP